MELIQALALKDAAIMATLTQTFQDQADIAAQILEGYKKGKENWEAYLAQIVGKEQAKTIIAEISTLKVG